MLNLVNVVFGRLTVVKKSESRRTTGGNIVVRWLCRCVCGEEKIVSANSLRQGKVKSCGCLSKELSTARGHKNKVHGGYSKLTSENDRVRWQALVNIHDRAKRRGYESDLEISDIPELTDFCPVLGIRYEKGSLKNKDKSPSIDRKNTNLPYLKKYKENLIFISHRANRIKSDASLEELKLIVEYVGSLNSVV